MSECGCWFLLLGPDEGDGAVGLQRPGPLPGPAVEHGQRGQRWRDAAASRHVPQLVGVPEDGVVVVQLDPAAGEEQEVVFTLRSVWIVYLKGLDEEFGDSNSECQVFTLTGLFLRSSSLCKKKRKTNNKSHQDRSFRLKGEKEMCVFNKQHCRSLLSFTYTPSRLQNIT